MRPSPMTPICICFTPYKNALFERCIHCVSQPGQSRIDILQMDPQRATAAFHQNFEIAAGLRGLHHAKTVGMARHVDIG